MSESQALCRVCGKVAANTCSMCGKSVCDEHYDSKLGICVICKAGRKTK